MGIISLFDPQRATRNLIGFGISDLGFGILIRKTPYFSPLP